jgi:hypothetical protein
MVAKVDGYVFNNMTWGVWIPAFAGMTLIEQA